MATILTRTAKGSALTYAEVDANFTNLNTFIKGIHYRTSALRTINNTTPVIVFETLVYDDGGGSPFYNTTSGVLTIPTTGLWLLSGKIQTLAVGNNLIQSVQSYIYKNGSLEVELDQVVGNNNATSFYASGGTVPLRLVAGDQITFRAASSNSTQTSFLAAQNYFTATLLGA